MEYEGREQEKLDLQPLLQGVLSMARRLWILGAILVLVCSTMLAALQKRNYVPMYQAYASFTVRVSNPLYSGVSVYNEKTAAVMAQTFPSILTSGLLQKRVMEELNTTEVPSIAVSATSSASILTLRVTNRDPEQAHRMLQAIIVCYPEIAELVVGPTELVMLDESGIPGAPMNSFSYRSHLLKGAVLGVALWVGLIALLMVIKNTVRDEDDLKKVLNVPCFSAIPAVRMPRRIACPLLNGRSSTRTGGFAESVRLMRLRVEKALEDSGKKVLLVSSAIPGEGKTTTTVNLAIVMAQKGKRVVLVDLDLRHPSVVRALNSRTAPLTTTNSVVAYLEGHCTVDSMLQEVGTPNLCVISGGTGTKVEYTEKHYRQLEMLINELRSRFDYVLLDTPPCALLADAAEVAGLAECGLLVVRQDFAGRERILDGVQRLTDDGLPLLGCVMNCVQHNAAGGYGYGYGTYGEKKD